MDRINSANFDTVGGKRIWRNHAPGVAGTTGDAAWNNAVQESILAIVETSGQGAIDGNDAQLFEGVLRMASAHISAVTATATLTIAKAGAILVDATAGNITLTLPAVNAFTTFAVGFEFLRLDTSANTVTVVPAGANQFKPGGLTAMPVLYGAPLRIVADTVSAWVRRSPPLPGIAVFSTVGTSTFTAPNDATRFWIDVVGGGGGGRALKIVNLTPGSATTVTIPAGGTAGAASTNGGNGGTTSFGALVSATGGLGGQYLGAAGGGGAGVGGDLNLSGGKGQFSVGSIEGGGGGSAPGYGQGDVGGSTSGGNAAGGGGSGGNPSAAGGPGGAGFVVVRW